MEAKRVLLVDDDRTTLTLGRVALEAVGHSVTCVDSGEEGIRLYKSGSFDVVLLDVVMPGVNGLQVLAAIREHDPEARVTLLTGLATKDVLLEALHLGAEAFIEKPVSPAQLKDAVERQPRFTAGRSVRGDLGSLSLPTLLQATCADRTRGRVRVRSDDGEAILYIADGCVVHAESGTFCGEEAVFRALGWADGEFEVTVGAEAPEHSVTADLPRLLLEGMRRLDEEQDAFESPTECEPDEKPSVREALLAGELDRHLTAAEGIIAAIVLDRSGRTLASWGPMPGLDRPGFASSVVALIAAARRPAGISEREEVEECLVRTASTLILVRPAGDLVLALVARADTAMLGAMRLVAGALTKRVAADLGPGDHAQDAE